MKKIQSILVIALGVCAMLTSCQELDTPINNIPTIETGEATEITATSALLSFKSENGKADCSLVYILSTSPDMNDVWESESNYIKDLIPILLIIIWLHSVALRMVRIMKYAER